MRGRELLQLIKSLTPREKDYVRAGFATEKNAAEYVLLFDAMLSQKTFDKKSMGKPSKLSERRISSLLPGFSRMVVQLLGFFHQAENQEFESSLAAAWKMAMRLQNGAAEAILLDLYARASEVERFDVILELYEIAEVMTEPVEIPGEGFASVVARRENLAAYEALRSALAPLKALSPAEKSHLLETTGGSELLDSENRPLSVRARLIYFWLKTRICFFGGRYAEAAQYQEQSIRLLEEHSWLKRESDFYIIKEHEPLIGFMFAANRLDAANALIFRVGNMPASQEREELMKWQQIFPLRLSVAINEGSSEKGEAAVADFHRIREQYGDKLPMRFVTKNLYWAAFYHLASGDFKAASKTSIQLLKEAKSANFDPPYLPMTRILSAVLSYEMGEYEDLIWQEKTFRMTTAYQESPFYKFILSLLRKLSLAKGDIQRQTILAEYQEKSAELEASGQVAAFFNFFDIGNWILSKQRQCAMLEVFEERALSLREADEGSTTAKTQ